MKAEQFPFDELLPEAPTTVEKPTKRRDRGRGILRTNKAKKQSGETTNENP